MSVPFFLARRIYRGNDNTKHVSKPATLIATAGTAIGLAVMIVSVAVVVGFKGQIKNKITGLGSHIQVTNLQDTRSYETQPIHVPDSMLSALSSRPGIAHVQRYSIKPGMIKTDNAFQGIVLKGIAQEYDTRFLQKCLVEGEIPVFSDSVSSNMALVSKTLAQKLGLNVGDKLYTYFIQNQVRARRFTITGFYQTNFTEFDEHFLITDLAMVNKLNAWQEGQVSGVELQVDDYDRLDEIAYGLALSIDKQKDGYGGKYYVRSVKELNPQIFAWLELLDLNVWVILVLMMGVAGFTMISGLLIIIIERTQMIGILKALGAANLTIRKTFLWLAVFLVGKGMVIGDLLGLFIIFVQSRYGLLKLDPTNYYLDTVPVSFNLGLFLLINLCTLLISVLMLIGPSYLITSVNPARSIRYE